MRVKASILFFPLLLLCACCWSQNFLRGKVFDKGSDRVVGSATVKNVSNSRISITDMGGNYKIPADEGDRIIISSVGYLADTIVVKQYMLNVGLDIFLKQNIIELEDVEVGELSQYQIDSLNRLEEFGDAVHHSKSKLVGGKGNTVTDGVGVTFSPITRFSKAERNERKFKKMFKSQEEEYYIDFKFPQNYVAKITGLEGDSLRVFMFTYRPTYAFCRANGKEGMLVYINDKYREYLHKRTPGSETKKKKKSLF
ncbi:MAG: carboxypeptidase-like regulatory domain-containing protein [Agriterribacter sp.]